MNPARELPPHGGRGVRFRRRCRSDLGDARWNRPASDLWVGIGRCGCLRSGRCAWLPTRSRNRAFGKAHLAAPSSQRRRRTDRILRAPGGVSNVGRPLQGAWRWYTVLTAIAGLGMTIWNALAYQIDAAHTGLSSAASSSATGVGSCCKESTSPRILHSPNPGDLSRSPPSAISGTFPERPMPRSARSMERHRRVIPPPGCPRL